MQTCLLLMIMTKKQDGKLDNFFSPPTKSDNNHLLALWLSIPFPFQKHPLIQEKQLLFAFEPCEM